MGVVSVHDLRKTYGPLVAVDDVSFDVEAGEIRGSAGASPA
jgi:ABC-2 type transport system ATP-binding protein